MLLTHHHFDHVSEVGTLRERWPELKVLIHPLERELLEGGGEASVASATVEAGETLRFGALEVRPLQHSRAHRRDAVVSGRSARGRAAPLLQHGARGVHGRRGGGLHRRHALRGSVGGVRAPGHTTYTDLRDSIMGTLMELPPDTVIYPGHADPTTVADEWEENSFIRVWRGLDPEGTEACLALGEPATLILLGEGTTTAASKAWVRWPDGSDDIVPGLAGQECLTLRLQVIRP